MPSLDTLELHSKPAGKSAGEGGGSHTPRPSEGHSPTQTGPSLVTGQVGRAQDPVWRRHPAGHNQHDGPLCLRFVESWAHTWTLTSCRPHLRLPSPGKAALVSGSEELSGNMTCLLNCSKMLISRTSLVAQELGRWASTAGSRVWYPVRELRSHMLRGVAINKYKKQDLKKILIYRQEHHFPNKNRNKYRGDSVSSTKCVCVCVCVLVTQLCSTLFNPIACSPPGSSVHGILQARILEWVVISFSGIFPTQGSNPSLLHCKQILYHLSHQGYWELRPGRQVWFSFLCILHTW